jgi:hypothetical protein
MRKVFSRPKLFCVLSGLMLGVVTAGCSRDSFPKTFPVKGRAVYQGSDRPVASGSTVELVSKSDPTLRAVGDVEENGAFTLYAFKDGKEKQGVVPGEYNVFVEVRGDDEKGERGGRVTLPGAVTIAPGDNKDLTIEIPAPGKRR